MSDEHLTDEVLSAVLDGEATPTEARHAGSCPMCGVRLAELQQAASLIGSPVAPADPVRRDAAIAAAVAARAVPIESRRRLPTWALGAAALVLAVLALVPLVLGGGDDDDTAADAPEMSLRADDSAGSAGGGSAGPVALGDLGAVDEDVLAARVQGALAAPAADVTAGDGADRTTSAAPAAGAAQESAEAAPCVAELAESTPGLGELRATGAAEVGGRRASVLAYASADGRIRVLAVAVDACDEVLLSVSFPAPQP